MSVKSRVMALDSRYSLSYIELIFRGGVSCLPAALLFFLNMQADLCRYYSHQYYVDIY